MAAGALANYLTATYNRRKANTVAVGVHVVCWILQFIGHGKFEGRKPALLDNLVQALFLAPMFVWYEVRISWCLVYLGFRVRRARPGGLRWRLEARWSVVLARFASCFEMRHVLMCATLQVLFKFGFYKELRKEVEERVAAERRKLKEGKKGE